MGPLTRQTAWPTWMTVLGIAVVSLLAGALGHPAVAEVVGGGVIVYVSLMLSRSLILRLEGETEPGRELVWDLLLILVIVMALVGVGVMAAAIP